MNIQKNAFRVIVGLLGLIIIYSGVDTAFGGFNTLGLQGIPQLWEVTDQATFDIIDSHQRLRGGVWMGVGVLILYGLIRWEVKLIQAAFFLTVVGGLSRFSQGRLDILFGAVFIVIFIELVITPLLWWWSIRINNALDLRSA